MSRLQGRFVVRVYHVEQLAPNDHVTGNGLRADREFWVFPGFEPGLTVAIVAVQSSLTAYIVRRTALKRR